jgi:acetyl-CoA C-acetyltransferase
MKEVVIVDGVRTPVGNFGGALKDVKAHKMGEVVVRELLNRTDLDPQVVDEVIFGCVAQPSDAVNIARNIALFSGMPMKTPAYTVQRNCSSGMQSIANAYQHIVCNDAEIVLAGGVENMSQAPYVSRDMRWGKRLRHGEFIDSIWEALTDAFCGQIMGYTAENLAEEFKISREEQDKFAVESHRKAFRAIREGKFKDEIVSVMVPKKAAGKEMVPEPFSQDEGPNVALNEQQLSLYPPVFKEGGTVTPGNSCALNDGAAVLLVMTKEKAQQLGYEPLGYIRSYAFVGVEPERMGIGPAEAIPAALKKGGLALTDMQLIEVNEAFAAQYLAVEKKLNLNREIVNVNGGAIALGHPVSMSGTRLVLTMLQEMKRRNLALGAASLCVGGGMGAAMILERK